MTAVSDETTTIAAVPEANWPPASPTPGVMYLSVGAGGVVSGARVRSHGTPARAYAIVRGRVPLATSDGQTFALAVAVHFTHLFAVGRIRARAGLMLYQLKVGVARPWHESFELPTRICNR